MAPRRCPLLRKKGELVLDQIPDFCFETCGAKWELAAQSKKFAAPTEYFAPEPEFIEVAKSKAASKSVKDPESAEPYVSPQIVTGPIEGEDCRHINIQLSRDGLIALGKETRQYVEIYDCNDCGADYAQESYKFTCKPGEETAIFVFGQYGKDVE